MGDGIPPLVPNTAAAAYANMVSMGTRNFQVQAPPGLDFDMALATAGDAAKQIVDSPKAGAMPGLSSHAKCMATANLALMALRVPGDFVETGVYYGATSVLMAQVLQQRDKSRRLWAADSFQGLPPEDPAQVVRQQHQNL